MKYEHDQIDESTRWNEIQAIWRDNRWLFIVAGWLVGILTLPALQFLFDDLLTLLSGLVPEAIGIIFTVLILDRLAANRAREALKSRLIREMGSPDNGIARLAGRELWDMGCLHDGTLVNADLWEANLANAQLYEANFAGVNFSRTNLNGTNLREANLAGAILKKGMWEAKLDKMTILPDGNKYDPSLGLIQLERFTDPNNPDFWQPKWIRQNKRQPLILEKARNKHR